MKKIGHIKNIIAVASGKGGVGKSTTAANLALALSTAGYKVAMVDADIHGPSQALILNVESDSPEMNGVLMKPKNSHGIEIMSMGMMSREDSPMIWGGTMTSLALEYMIHYTEWSEIDYMIVDMPPGTGDIAITMLQKIPVTAGVIVTTPQDVALIDVKKGLSMFQKLNIPIAGIIENMSMHVCSNCGNVEHIFGEGGGKNISENFNVKFLGSLPLEKKIRIDADCGCPTVISEPDGLITAIYKNIAISIKEEVDRLNQEDELEKRH